MKKFLIVIGVLLVLVLAAAAILPVIFKDDIKKAVDKELDGVVDADIYFDPDKFGLSLFSNFPNFTVSLGDFGVIGRDEFDGEILFAAQRFEVVIDLSSVVFGSQPNINAIILDNVKTNIIVLENGKANYDIAIESEEETVSADTTQGSAEFAISIDHWEINDADIVYDDRSMQFYTKIENLDHSGSGDFTQDIFDLSTSTQVEDLRLIFEGSEYVSDKSLDIDMTLNMNLPESKYTFKENTVRINDFSFGFDGWLVLADAYDMDITFASKENTFKSILSLVPGMFTEDFDNITTEGNLAFSGAVKGTYSDSLGQMPAFNVKLNVDDAMFNYPDLPTAAENISVDMTVDNADGVIENTVVHVNQFHVDLGNNPVDAKILVENLKNYPIDAQVNAKVNLAELTSVIPMEGLELKGLFTLNASADGYYDSIKNIIPKLDIQAELDHGYMKYSEYPIPLENISMVSTVKNTTGKLNDTRVNVKNFELLVDGEKLTANAVIENLDDPAWDVHVHGGMDLSKIGKIIHLEGVTMDGLVKADIDTKGRLSYLEKERYDLLPTKGSMTVNNFNYVDKAVLPMGFAIKTANLVFDPSKIDLTKFSGSVGESDLNLTGAIRNYMGFAMSDKEVLKGNFVFTSKYFNANEWMTETDTTTGEEPTEDSEESEIEPVQIPKNIDFLMKSTIAKVEYDNLTLSNLKGNIVVRDGILKLEDAKFNTLNGDFSLNGTYDPRDIDHPKFDFKFGIDKLSIPQAYSAFTTVKAAAPIAQVMKGDFSTDFSMSGELTQEMLPDFNTISGGGLLKIAQAAITGSKVMNNISSLTSLAGFTNSADQGSSKGVGISDVLMQTEIKDGKINIKPTTFKLGGYKTQFSGSSNFAGQLDYKLAMDVPGGAGQAFTSAVSKFAGSSFGADQDAKVNIGVVGPYDDPKVKLLGVTFGGKTAKEVAKDAITSKALDKLGLSSGAAGDSSKTVEQQKEEAKQEVKQKAEEKAEDVKEDIKEEAKKKLKKLFGG